MVRRKGWLKRRFKLNLRNEALVSIAYILLFLLALVIALSFTQQGVLLYQLNTILMQIFGWGTIFLVFFFLLSGIMLTKINVPWNQAGVLLGGMVLALSLIGISKAGLVGKKVFEQIAFRITNVGAYGFLFASCLIGFVIFFNTSFDQVLSFVINIFKSLGGLFSKKREPQFMQNRPEMENKTTLQKQVSSGGTGRQSAVKEVEEMPVSVSLPAVPGAQASVWNYPPMSLLSTDDGGGKADRGDVKNNAGTIERTLSSFGIDAKVAEVNYGPAVTQYAIEVPLGTKLSKITALSSDLALALAAPTGQIRVEAPIPGRSLVGIELPNRSLEVVTLRQILGGEGLRDRKNKLMVPLGLDVSGRPQMANIAKMPHVLIAGQTGSGKSVLLNSWIASFLFRTTPSEVELILIDPKRVEFTQYNNVPHLHFPVIVEKEKIIKALEWATREMDQRYKLFSQVGARNIETYNEISGFQALPYIVIIIDELADIIMFAPARVEDAICRIAQMARATGIHLIIATQRPSVDVLTGLIKANIPCRISFAVSSMMDSRVILDSPGAEKLLGRGDMLYIPPDQAKPSRIQGAYVSEAEIKKLLEFLSRNGLRPVYTEAENQAPLEGSFAQDLAGEKDALFAEVVRFVCQEKRASASLLQRKFSVGYARAARILDQLQEAGVIGPGDGAKPREILIGDAEGFLSSGQK